MNRTLLKFGLVTTLCGLTVAAFADKTPTAKAVMDATYAKAAKSKKNVLVIFHASWCGWCHRFDKFLAEPIGKKVSDGLEIVHIDVMEQPGAHKADENAGGMELMSQLKGAEAGLPFMAILDSKGKMIINSLDPKNKNMNTGYPGEPSEIAHFGRMLEVGAPKISAADRKALTDWLTAHKPSNH